MAKSYPPYVNATGLTKKILDKIKEAATPERFTQDFLNTKLRFSGGSAKAFIPLAKRIGFLAGDGTPTEIYKQFRNPKTSKIAMAKAIKLGYSDLYIRNESLHNLNKTELKGLVMEATGLEKDNPIIQAIVATFEALKGFADFEIKEKPETGVGERAKAPGDETAGEEFKLNLSYTINLVLPKTEDVAVFNAIFKSLKENLLRK